MAGLKDLSAYIPAGITERLSKLFGGSAPAPSRKPAPQRRRKTYDEMTPEERRAQQDREAAQFWLKGVDTSTYKGDIPLQIGGYRADPKGKYGGKNGLETMPTNLPAAELYAKVRAMKLGEKYGVPQLSPQQLAALALKEGNGVSGVFGVDPVWDKNNPDPNKRLLPYDPHMKGDKELYDKLVAAGIGEQSAAFAIRLANKQRIAQRLGIPLEKAWVGTGNSGYETGDQYADTMTHFYRAAAHPRNKPLIDFIAQAMNLPQPKRKAEGGVVIDDGNPAKQRKLI